MPPRRPGISVTVIQWNWTTVVPLQDTDREVTSEEGENFAKTHGCLFVETSAKADVAVTQAFEELVLKVSASLCRGSH